MGLKSDIVKFGDYFVLIGNVMLSIFNTTINIKMEPNVDTQILTHTYTCAHVEMPWPNRFLALLTLKVVTILLGGKWGERGMILARHF